MSPATHANGDSGPLRSASAELASAGVPDLPRARSVSGEIRVPIRRAASIRPQMPEPLEEADDDTSSPVIVFEVSEPHEIAAESTEDPTAPRKVPVRRRPAKTDPPELAARAGEVEIETGPIRRVDLDEPRIIIADDLEQPASLPETSGELGIVTKRDDNRPPMQRA